MFEVVGQYAAGVLCFHEFVCVFPCDVEIMCHFSKAEYLLVHGRLALKKGCRFDGAKSGL